MKRKICIVLICGMLCGCVAEPTLETIGDCMEAPALQQQKKLVLDLPEEGYAIRGTSGTVYIYDGYTVTVEVLSGGNIGATMESITGFHAEELTVMQTAVSELTRYECAWAATGEGGDMVGNAAVLFDGVWHYCVTMECSAAEASKYQSVWSRILRSVQLV